ncbi:MAG: C39 family peptidase [Hespellia sp.]|nr:C39 family peptidase [Hespellia sp.]
MDNRNNRANKNQTNQRERMIRRLKRQRQRQLIRRALLCIFTVIIALVVFNLGKLIKSAVSPSDTKKTEATKTEMELQQKAQDASKEEVQTVPKPGEIAIPAPVAYLREDAIAVLSAREAENKEYTAIVENAAAYPDNLLVDLANNQEMLEFVQGYPQEAKSLDKIKLTAEEIASPCPLFQQWDQRWGYQPYGEDNIAISGCGPTTLSMAIVGLTHNADATPAQVAEFATANGYYTEGYGSSWDLIIEGAGAYGLTTEELSRDEGLMKEALDQGALIICSMDAGDFTTAGHFLVICGYGPDGFQINDSFCVYRSNQSWSFEQLHDQIGGMWTVR